MESLKAKTVLSALATALLAGDSETAKLELLALNPLWRDLPAAHQRAFRDDMRWRIYRFCRNTLSDEEVASIRRCEEDWRRREYDRRCVLLDRRRLPYREIADIHAASMLDWSDYYELRRRSFMSRLLRRRVWLNCARRWGRHQEIDEAEDKFLRDHDGKTFIYYTPKQRIAPFVRDVLTPRLRPDIVPVYGCRPRHWKSENSIDVSIFRSLVWRRAYGFAPPFLMHICDRAPYVYACSNLMHLAARRPKFLDKLLAYIDTVSKKEEKPAILQVILPSHPADRPPPARGEQRGSGELDDR